MKTYKVTLHVPALSEDWIREFEAPDYRGLLTEIQEYMDLHSITEYEINTTVKTSGYYTTFIFEDIILN